MLVLIAAILCLLLGVSFLWKRVELARVQSLLAGGRFAPGCAVAQGMVLLSVALVLFLVWTFGHP
jgi:hypothetical protein